MSLMTRWPTRWRWQQWSSTVIASDVVRCHPMYGSCYTDQCPVRLNRRFRTGPMRLIACSDRRHGQVKTVLSCPYRRCEHNWRQDKTVDPVSTLQLFSLSWGLLKTWKLGRDKTKLTCLVCSCVHTADTDKTRQSCLVRVGCVNKLLKSELAGALACL